MCLNRNISETVKFEEDGIREEITFHAVVAGAASARDW